MNHLSNIRFVDVCGLMEAISVNPDCHVIPKLNHHSDLKLPKDLLEFYRYCNGVELFIHSEYAYKIVGIDEIARTDLRMRAHRYIGIISLTIIMEIFYRLICLRIILVVAMTVFMKLMDLLVICR